jgi:G2/mitotic-specific cyclin 2
VDEEKGNGMEVEEPKPGIFDEPEAETSLIAGEQEVEAMVDLNESEVGEEVEEREVIKPTTEPKPPRIWPGVSTDRVERCRREVDAVRKVFEDGIDVYDATVVSEYAGGIFDYTGDPGVGCHILPVGILELTTNCACRHPWYLPRTTCPAKTR